MAQLKPKRYFCFQHRMQAGQSIQHRAAGRFPQAISEYETDPLEWRMGMWSIDIYSRYQAATAAP